MWTGDGFGALDTVLAHAGRKEALERAIESENMFGAPKTFGGRFGMRLEML
jgi:hypothetical protein